MKSLSSYYSDTIKKNPLLTHEQEIELSKRTKSGDLQARQKLIESNYGLVMKIAKKYLKKKDNQQRNFDFEDLLQESSMGLIKAVDRFDPDLGNRFSTYACWWIKQAAIEYINEHGGSFKVPTYSRLFNMKINNVIREEEKKTGKKPNAEKIAFILNENVKKVQYTIEANKTSLSLDYENSDDENKTTLKDKINDRADSLNPEKCYENNELNEIIRMSLKTLTPKEEKIIRLRFGIGESSNNTKQFPVTDEMKEYLTQWSLKNTSQLVKIWTV